VFLFDIFVFIKAKVKHICRYPLLLFLNLDFICSLAVVTEARVTESLLTEMPMTKSQET
jgi:hypothetical protein